MRKEDKYTPMAKNQLLKTFVVVAATTTTMLFLFSVTRLLIYRCCCCCCWLVAEWLCGCWFFCSFCVIRLQFKSWFLNRIKNDQQQQKLTLPLDICFVHTYIYIHLNHKCTFDVFLFFFLSFESFLLDFFFSSFVFFWMLFLN